MLTTQIYVYGVFDQQDDRFYRGTGPNICEMVGVWMTMNSTINDLDCRPPTFWGNCRGAEKRRPVDCSLEAQILVEKRRTF